MSIASPDDHAPATDAAEEARIQSIGLDQIDVIRKMNKVIFDTEHIIRTFDRPALLILLATVGGAPAGFKIGYERRGDTFYSAKGGVMPAFRRRGIARALLYDMVDRARQQEYRRFMYDTFPNKHPGMTVLGLDEEFEVIQAGYSSKYQDYRLRFAKSL